MWAGRASGRCHAWARTLGAELRENADHVFRRPLGDSPPLTGLSHDAAGIAAALLELHDAAGEDACLHAARRAFAHEDALFDPTERNWLDLRPYTRHGAAPRCATTWCHGAPGIALARLRAADLGTARRDEHLDRARTALDTTRRELARLTRLDTFDGTPCHDAAGLVEALWTGGHALDDAALRHAALRAAARLTGTWRSDASCGGPNPSLTSSFACGTPPRFRPSSPPTGRRSRRPTTAEKAATTGGIVIDTRARMGYAAPIGSTDEDRVRHLTVALPPRYAARLFDAQEAGATDQQLQQIAAEALREVYFQDGGRRAGSLRSGSRTSSTSSSSCSGRAPEQHASPGVGERSSWRVSSRSGESSLYLGSAHPCG